MVGYTSEELSILLSLFATRTADALPMSMIGDKFGCELNKVKSMKNDFAPDISFASFTGDATILDVSNLKFSSNVKSYAFALDTVANDVSVPLGLVADVVLTCGLISVPSNSKVCNEVFINSNL